MGIPSYASSMVDNYRDMFRKEYGTACTLSSEQIWQVCNDVFNDMNKGQGDADRVREMWGIQNG